MTLRSFFLAAFVALAGTAINAQKIAFVNTKVILEKMPEYAAAQAELDRLSAQWQKELDDRWEGIQRLRDAYNAEMILLTEEMKKSRMEEITKRERDARDLQNKRFGPKGDLFKKREELIQPIQDRIYQAIKEVAGTSYAAIFDIGSLSNQILFASEKYDKTNEVMRKLGIRPDKNTNSGNVREGEEEDGREEDAAPGGTTGGGTENQQRGGGETKPRQ
jgi:outer membrane protein